MEFRGAAPNPDAVGTLAPWELAVLRMARGQGVGRFVATVCVGVSLTSLLICSAILWATGPLAQPKFWFIGLALAGGIPSLIAPVVVYAMTRLVQRLDAHQLEMHRLAATDSLTGVPNRRGFFAQAREHQAELCDVLLLDLDSFKSINDRWGHAVGDEALSHVAAWLREVVGDDGCVARFGGDEFIALAPPSVFDSISYRVEFRLNDMDFSASTGRTRWRESEAIDTAIARADRELYRMKGRGRTHRIRREARASH